MVQKGIKRSTEDGQKIRLPLVSWHKRHFVDPQNLAEGVHCLGDEGRHGQLRDVDPRKTLTKLLCLRLPHVQEGLVGATVKLLAHVHYARLLHTEHFLQRFRKEGKDLRHLVDDHNRSLNLENLLHPVSEGRHKALEGEVQDVPETHKGSPHLDRFARRNHGSSSAAALRTGSPPHQRCSGLLLRRCILVDPGKHVADISHGVARLQLDGPGAGDIALTQGLKETLRQGLPPRA
mmetsp:Transcript_30229/g.96545  ORF Transcript_30229/g.96545 Transcript_30229/m.96545 type:complete len:234 (+) Transcript_30229:603-1304(+)